MFTVVQNKLIKVWSEMLQKCFFFSLKWLEYSSSSQPKNAWYIHKIITLQSERILYKGLYIKKSKPHEKDGTKVFLRKWIKNWLCTSTTDWQEIIDNRGFHSAKWLTVIFTKWHYIH